MNVVCGLCESVRILVDLRWEMSAVGSRDDVSTKRRWSREKGGKGSAGSEREMCEISVEEGEGRFGGSGRKKRAVEAIFETSGEDGRGIQQPLLFAGTVAYTASTGISNKKNKGRCHCFPRLEVIKSEWILRGKVSTRVISKMAFRHPPMICCIRGPPAQSSSEYCLEASRFAGDDLRVERANRMISYPP